MVDIVFLSIVRRPFEIGGLLYRISCSIREYPPNPSVQLFAQRVLRYSVLSGSLYTVASRNISHLLLNILLAFEM